MKYTDPKSDSMLKDMSDVLLGEGKVKQVLIVDGHHLDPELIQSMTKVMQVLHIGSRQRIELIAEEIREAFRGCTNSLVINHQRARNKDLRDRIGQKVARELVNSKVKLTYPNQYRNHKVPVNRNVSRGSR